MQFGRRTEASASRRASSDPTIRLPRLRKLSQELSEPYRSIVQPAVLTGTRIGEIFGFRRKRVDLLHRALELARLFPTVVSELRRRTAASRASHRLTRGVLLVSLDYEDGFIVNAVLLAIPAQLVISF